MCKARPSPIRLSLGSSIRLQQIFVGLTGKIVSFTSVRTVTITYDNIVRSV